MQCHNCKSDQILTERKIDGDCICSKCNHRWKNTDKLPSTSLETGEKLTEDDMEAINCTPNELCTYLQCIGNGAFELDKFRQWLNKWR